LVSLISEIKKDVKSKIASNECQDWQDISLNEYMNIWKLICEEILEVNYK